MRYEEFVSSYSGKTDDELLRLELDSEQLDPEATIALKNELVKRNISGPERLEAFRISENERKREIAKNPGNLFLTHFGIGRWYFGKAARVRSPDGKWEQFRTTVFTLFFYFPLVPTGTYLVKKKCGFMAGKIAVVEKLPLDWRQVFTVWGVALASIVAVIWVLRHL